MKNLEEKKLLLNMMRAFGQEDKELAESIRREEELSKVFFKEEKHQEIKIIQKPVKEEVKVLVEADPVPPDPPPAFTPPVSNTINQTVNYLNTVSPPSIASTMANKEIEGIKKTIAEMMQKISTLSWGGGGTGVVRYYDLDDHQYPTDVKLLQFNTEGPDNYAALLPGSMGWNPTEDCLNIYQNDGTTLQVGLEQYIRVRNLTGNTMIPGTLVQFAGVNGGNDPIAVPLLANSTFNPIYTIGVLAEPIANNDSGRATTFGKVRGMDSTGTIDGETWSIGNILWADPVDPGRLTNVKPTAPNVAISIAAVTKVDAVDGEILVRPTITPRLYYGDFVRTNGQTANVANTPYVVGLNKTEFASGFTLNANSEMVALESGLYKVSVTLNFSSSSANLVRFYHWIRVNGVDITDSTVRNSLASNGGDAGTSSNHIVSLNAGDNVQVMWATEGTQVALVSAANTAFAPSSPSAIINIFQVTL
jgi:hypothetical protein